MVRARGDKGTLDLLGWEPESAGAHAPELRGPAEVVIPRLVSDALKLAGQRGHNRDEVAHSLSVRLDRKVSKDTLDAWASPARAANRIPLDAACALVAVTGDLSLIRWMAAQAGQVLVDAAHAPIVEDVVLLKQVEEKERALAALKATALARLGGRP